MSPIADNLQGVLKTCNAIGRRGQLAGINPPVVVAVSKTKPAADVRSAFLAGQRHFGENYVQEAVAKIAQLHDLRAKGLQWHLIGPLQSNKARLVATHFDWVQTVDRAKIADALSRVRTELGLAPLNILIQVNVSNEVSKSGVSPTQVGSLVSHCRALHGVRVRGLMAIIENSPNDEVLRRQFRAMRNQFDEIVGAGSASNEMDTLSMGMSGDFQLAIEEGSTMVRIGSRIFGAREPSVVNLAHS
jgi:PLP dependent protein